MLNIVVREVTARLWKVRSVNAIVKYTAFWDMTPCYTILNYQTTRSPHNLKTVVSIWTAEKTAKFTNLGRFSVTSSTQRTKHCTVTHYSRTSSWSWIMMLYCCSSADEFWRKICSCLHLDNKTQHYTSKRRYEPTILDGFETHSTEFEEYLLWKTENKYLFIVCWTTMKQTVEWSVQFNNEFKKWCQEALVAKREVQSQQMPVGTTKNHSRTHLVQLVSGQIFEPRTPWIQTSRRYQLTAKFNWTATSDIFSCMALIII
jgi:hypothetical protein